MSEKEIHELNALYQMYETYKGTPTSDLVVTDEMKYVGGGFNTDLVPFTFGDFVDKIQKHDHIKQRWLQKTFNPRGRVIYIKK